jgi:hypothetical protein
MDRDEWYFLDSGYLLHNGKAISLPYWKWVRNNKQPFMSALIK